MSSRSPLGPFGLDTPPRDPGVIMGAGANMTDALLERNPAADLDLPGRSGARDQPKIGAVYVQAGHALEVYVIDGVVRLHAKLEARAFGNLKVPEQRQIEVLIARHAGGVAAQIANSQIA